MPDWKEDRQKKVVEASDGAGEEDSGGEAGDNEAEGQVGRDKAEGNVTVERPEVASVRAAAEDGTTSVGAEVEQQAIDLHSFADGGKEEGGGASSFAEGAVAVAVVAGVAGDNQPAEE